MTQIDYEIQMRFAYQEAKKAFEQDEIPIGAALFIHGQCVAKGHNQTELLKDPTAHAEIIAITQACYTLQSKYLDQAVLYTTVEPCVMCYGAIVNAKIKTLVYAVSEPKTGFSVHIQTPTKLKIVKGIMEADAKELMLSFFQTKRQ